MRVPTTPQRGFTLVEVLLASAILAVLALLSWRGIDAMLRAQERVRQHDEAVLTLQAGLAQWQADLDALASVPHTSALDWDGRTLRLSRQAAGAGEAGLRVVAWGRREHGDSTQWLRWQSDPVHTREQWQTAWQQAVQWSQAPDDRLRRQEVAIVPLAAWQIFYHRGDAWSHPLSSAAATPAPSGAGQSASLPDGVRLVLTLPSGPAIGGVLTRDWVRPTLAGNKS